MTTDFIYRIKKAVSDIIPRVGQLLFLTLASTSLLSADPFHNDIVFDESWGKSSDEIPPSHKPDITDNLPTPAWKPVSPDTLYNILEEQGAASQKARIPQLKKPPVHIQSSSASAKKHDHILYPLNDVYDDSLPSGKVIQTAQELLKAIAPTTKAQAEHIAAAPDDPKFQDLQEAFTAALIAQSPDPTALGPTPPQPAAKTIVINFNNVSIIEVIRFLSRISGKNFIFSDEDLQFNVTIVSEEPSSIEDVMTALLQELRIRGLFLIVQGNNILIHNNKVVRGISEVIADGLPMTEQRRRAPLVTRVFRLNTLTASKAQSIIIPLLSDEAQSNALDDTNHLIVTDLTYNVNQIENLVKSIDSPNSGLVIGQYVVINAFLETMINMARTIMSPIAVDKSLVFVPHAASNSIFIVSTPFIVERTLAVLQYLDATVGTTRIIDQEALRFNGPGATPQPGVPFPGTPGYPGFPTAPGTAPGGFPGAPGTYPILPGQPGYPFESGQPGYGSPFYPGGPGGPGAPGAPGAPTGVPGAPGTIPGTAPGQFGPGGVPGTETYQPPAIPGAVPPGGYPGYPAEYYTPGYPGGVGTGVPGGPFQPGVTPGQLGPGGAPGYYQPGAGPGQVGPGGAAGYYQPGLEPGQVGPGGAGGYYQRGLQPGAFYTGGAVSELPSGHIQRTQFSIIKLRFRKGDQIVDALTRIAQSLAQTGNVNTDLISTINSIQFIESSNSLVLTGTTLALAKVSELISEIDTPLRQVFIEMLILRTSLGDSLNYGVNWGARFGGGNTAGAEAFLSGASTLNGILDTATPAIGNAAAESVLDASSVTRAQGFNLGIVGRTITRGGVEFATIAALIKAVHVFGTVDVVLTPKILTEDNTPAEIFVGTNTPFQTQSIANDQGSIVTNNFEFRDVGTRLTVTPLISDDDIITMEIQQEISRVRNIGSTSGLVQQSPGPSTDKTTTRTKVHVPNKYFLVISGMIDEEVSKTREQVPCLGCIPFLGALFSEVSTRDTKSNLMVFIRPEIIDTEQQIRHLTKTQQDIWINKNKYRSMCRSEIEEAMDWMNVECGDDGNIHMDCDAF